MDKSRTALRQICPSTPPLRSNLYHRPKTQRTSTALSEPMIPKIVRGHRNAQMRASEPLTMSSKSLHFIRCARECYSDVSPRKHAIYYHGLKCNHCQEVLKTQAQYVHHFKLNNRCKKAPRAPQVGKRQRKRTSKLFVTDIVGTENVLEFLEVTRSGSDTNAWFDAYEALFGSESRPSESRSYIHTCR